MYEIHKEKIINIAFFIEHVITDFKLIKERLIRISCFPGGFW